MNNGKPVRLFFILALLTLLVIWIPVLQQLSPGAESAFSLESWLLLSALASVGVMLLFALLYFISRRR